MSSVRKERRKVSFDRVVVISPPMTDVSDDEDDDETSYDEGADNEGASDD